MRRHKHFLGLVVILVVVGLLVLLWPERTDDPDLPDAPTAEPPSAPPVEEPQPGSRAQSEETEPESSEAQRLDELDCKADMPRYDKLPRSEVNRIVREAIVLLRSTQGHENLLAAAILSRGRDSTVELLNQLGGEDSTNPLVLWTGLSMCESGSVGCDYERVAANVRANHSSNAAFWIALAGNDLANGREGEATAAMNAALAAPGFDGYFAEQYMLLDRAFASTTNWSGAERVIQIVEYLAASPPGFQRVVRQCVSPGVVDWAPLCDQLVSKLQGANELTARLYAYELELKLLEAREQTEEAKALQERSIAATIGVDGDEELLAATANALLNDEVLLSRFLQDVESLGEIAAFRQLTEDIERLRSSQRDEECKFIANPYFDFR